MRATTASTSGTAQEQERRGWVSIEDLDTLATRVDLLFKLRLRTPHAPEYRYSEISKVLARLGVEISGTELKQRPPALLAELASAGREHGDRSAAMRAVLVKLVDSVPATLTPAVAQALVKVAQPNPPRQYNYTEVATALRKMGVSVSTTHLKSLRTEKGLNPSATLLNALASFFDIPVEMLQTPMNESERQKIRAFFLDLLQDARIRCLGTIVAKRLNYLLNHTRDDDNKPYNYNTIARRVTDDFDIPITARDIQVLHEGRDPNDVNCEHLRGLARFFLVPAGYFDMEDEHQVRLINQQVELLAAARATKARGQSPVFLRALVEAILGPDVAAEMRRKQPWD
jgi:hypothetical protein